MIARVLGLIDSPPTRTTPTWESDILHPLLLIFDSRSPSVQKVYPRRSRASSEEGRIPCEGRPDGGNPLTSFRTRERRSAARELAIVSLAGLASFLFINHENLYLSGPFALSNAPLEAYFLATIVIYLFLRMLISAAGMRPTRVRSGSVRCPECGQRLDTLTAAGREAHHRIELTPKPSEKEVVSAVALRKAVDAAHLSVSASKMASRDGLVVPRRDLENISGHDLVAAIDDPDLLERLLHGPNPPRDPRLKR